MKVVGDPGFDAEAGRYHYPNLWAYTRKLNRFPGIAPTVKFDIYKQGDYSANPKRNPLGIVPVGPEIDWSQ